MNEFWKMKFLFCFLLSMIGLKNHLADCFVEHSGFDELKIFMVPTKNRFGQMEQITHDIRLEIMCHQMMYQYMQKDEDGSVIAISWAVTVVALKYSYEFLRAHLYHKSLGHREEAQLFAKTAAYLAAFGANTSNKFIYEKEVLPHVHLCHLDKNPYGKETFAKDIPVKYLPWLESTREELFKNYINEEKYFQVVDRNRLMNLEKPTRECESYLSDILFATNPAWPGSALVPTSNYIHEKLWTWPTFIDAIKNIVFSSGSASSGTNASSSNNDELPGASLVIQILRETEVQKIKLNRLERTKKDMTDEEIRTIKEGFTDGSILKVHLLKMKYLAKPTLLFTKFKGGEDMLANYENMKNAFPKSLSLVDFKLTKPLL